MHHLLTNKNTRLLFLLFLPLWAIAQGPKLQPLAYNPKLVKNKFIAAPKKEKALNDTVQLPFLEDFSGPEGYPDAKLFIDSNVYVNRDFAIGPPTIGCATFDGTNKYGYAYSENQTLQGPADSLTSKPINMGGLTAADSVYFSFLYQPQGLGDGVEGNDRLELYFFNKDLGTWVRVWYETAVPLDTFKLVMLPVTQSVYLDSAFRFRFINVGALYGMFDTWNLDYIYINKGRNVNDTTFKDVGFVYNSPSLLEGFQHIPFTQTPALISKIRLTETNISNTPINTSYTFTANYNQPQCSANVPGTLDPVYTNGYNTFSQQFQPVLDDCVFPTMTSESEFIITHVFRAADASQDMNYRNDTLVYRQIFSDYYAFDDGGAEASYGLYAFNAAAAVKVTLKNADTLRAVHFYFAKSWNNIQSQNFRLMVWLPSTTDPNVPGDSIYYKDAVSPIWQDSINEFTTYYIDDQVLTFPAGQTIFVGWKQANNYDLQVGFDKNVDHSDITYFYHNNGAWTPSPYAGSLMIRPVVGDVNVSPMGVNEPVAAKNYTNITLYPNPATDIVRIANYTDFSNTAINYTVYNLQGAYAGSGKTTNGQLDTTNLESGFYLVALTNSKGQTITRKLIITR